MHETTLSCQSDLRTSGTRPCHLPPSLLGTVLMNPHNSVTSRVPADLSNKRVGGAGCCRARVAGEAQLAVGGQ